MDMDARFPAVSDLRDRARRRIPRFAWEYLDSATGDEHAQVRNRTKLNEVLFNPSILHGEFTPDLSTELLGYRFPLPFGVAPVGMAGLMWPGAERLLAKAAAKAGMPYTLSGVATRTPEDIAPVLGEHGWFQLYPPRDEAVRRDILKRARDAGFRVLVLTVDVPVASRRERVLRSGLTNPPRLTPRILAQIASRPAWAFGTARIGMPRMRMLDPYVDRTVPLPPISHVGYMLRTSPDYDYLRWLRNNWDGPLAIKGVMNPQDARKLAAEGVDALWVSNHGGRQFDGAPAAIEVLAHIRAETNLPLIFDSGIRNGLDILRALALGADFVMLGRPWYYALGALGARGPTHLIDLLVNDLKANMGQIGARCLRSLPLPVQGG